MRKYISLIASMAIAVSVFSQYEGGKMIPTKDEAPLKSMKDDSYLLASTITAKEMKEHLSILASDEYQGRETGEPGNDIAAAYLKKQLEALDLPKVGEREGYYQNVAFTFSSWTTNEVQVNNKEYRQLWDYLGFPQSNKNMELTADEVVFAGYGLSQDAYSDIDVNGKVVLVYEGAPQDENGTTLSAYENMSTDFESKRALAQENGAALILIISNDLKEILNANRRILVNRVTEIGNTSQLPDDHTNMLIISSTMAQEMLGENVDEVISMRDQLRSAGTSITAKSYPTELSISQEIKKDVLDGQNVLGLIEGTDKKDELVIVSAHYDHVGMKGKDVFNGADDNGSGTTTVLEIAEALTVAKRIGKGPRRSVLCLWMTGEEKGLLGSEYYMTDPLYPADQTVADVNIDMVGRWGEEYEGSETPYVYVIGSDRLSQDLHDINEEMNQKYSQMILDYKYNDENDPNRFYYRSDHYNFAKNGIPAIFFFNGVHDDYHRISDTVDKIDFDLMEQRGKLIFHTIWNLANRDDRIRLNEPNTNPTEEMGTR